MSVILFIVNVLLSGRRALSELFPGFEQDLMLTERCRSGPVSVFALSARAATPSRNAISAGLVTPCHGRQSSRAVRQRVETFGDSSRAYMERTGRIFPSI
jgi:hypothetical protein